MGAGGGGGGWRVEGSRNEQRVTRFPVRIINMRAFYPELIWKPDGVKKKIPRILVAKLCQQHFCS